MLRVQGVDIRSNVSSPFTNAVDPFWSTQCGSLCGSFIPDKTAYRNVSYYDAFIYDYRFMKSDWVAVSQVSQRAGRPRVCNRRCSVHGSGVKRIGTAFAFARLGFLEHFMRLCDYLWHPQGRNITGTGFWGYTDVALTWRPSYTDSGGSGSGGDVPVAAIAVPVAVGGALRQAPAAAATAPAAMSGTAPRRHRTPPARTAG